MTIDHAVELCREAVMLSLLLGAPVLAVAIAVGLVISILQAVTQLQDQTLSFVPKIVAMLLTLLYVLPWTLHELIDYSTVLFREIPTRLF